MSKPFHTLGEIAKRWHCSHSTVLALVRAGYLTAIDISTNPAGRSRHIIPGESLAEFEPRRTVAKPATAVKKNRAKIKRRDIIEFIS